MHKIWCERPIPEKYLTLLEGQAVVIGVASDTPGDPFAKIADAEGIIAAARIRYDAALLSRTPRLKVIARTGIGCDNIDDRAATARGVTVCNAPDGPTVSTAEHAIALMMAATKKLKKWDGDIRSGEKKDNFTLYDGWELYGKTLGLAGLGRIGSHVARIAAALGMRVLAYDPFIPADRAKSLGVERAGALEDLLRQSDVVSLHLPLTDKTRHLIGRDQFRLMKPGAFLVNTGRGGLVDEQALVEALDSGHLQGAGLDVFETEPPPAGHPLLGRDDVVATPHIAAGTDRAKERLWTTAITQVLQVCRGEKPPHAVNPQLWENNKPATAR